MITGILIQTLYPNKNLRDEVDCCISAADTVAKPGVHYSDTAAFLLLHLFIPV